MPYTTQSKIQTAIPANVLNDALDDNRDGMADDGILDEIIESASTQVDAYLASSYVTPFTDPIPAKVSEAAFLFACERIYDRRELIDKNPYRARADEMRAILKLIAQGEIQLDASRTTAIPAASGGQPFIPSRIPMPPYNPYPMGGAQ